MHPRGCSARIERTLNLKPNQWVPYDWLHPLGLQTYEITPCGALGGSETYANAAFGALRGCKPYGNAACGAHGAVLGIANPMRMQHAAPLGLTFPGHRRILLGITLARGCPSHPLALPLQPFASRTALHVHTRGCVRDSRARWRDTHSVSAFLAPAGAQRRTRTRADGSSGSQRRNSNPATTLEPSAHSLRQQQPNGETQRRRATITHCIAAPAAAQRRNSTPKAKTAGSSTRQARAPAQSASRAYSVGCALPRPPRLARDGLLASAQNAKAPRDRGVGGEKP